MGHRHRKHHHSLQYGSGIVVNSIRLIVNVLFLICLYNFLKSEITLFVVGAWSVSEGCEVLSPHCDASILGGLVIAWLNTLPEAIFFIKGLHSNNVEFAVGALGGSANVHPTIAVGLCLLIGALRGCSGENRVYLYKSVRIQAKLLGVSSIIVLMVVVFGFNFFVGIFGFLCYGCFFAFTVLAMGKEEDDDSIQQGQPTTILPSLEDDNTIVTISQNSKKKIIFKGVGFLVLGSVLLLVFSESFIHVVIEVAEEISLSQLALSYLISPIASEAPEVLESIMLSWKGKESLVNIAFSNLIGGTATKTTLLMGVMCFFGHYRNFEWEFPSFTVSLLLVAVTGMYFFQLKETTVFVNGVLGFYPHHSSYSGIALLLLFCFNVLIQMLSEMYFKKHVYVLNVSLTPN